MSEPSIDEEGSVPPTEAGDKGDNPPPRKRQRVRLSCLECRRRKLSCDREFPCSRCLQSGTPERCEYETRPGLAPPNKLGLAQSPLSSFDTRLSLPNGGGDSSFYRRDSLREHDRIRRLELEVAQLKGLLAKQCSTDGSTLVGTSPSTQQAEEKNETRAQSSPSHLHNPNEVDLAKDELRFFRGKEWKTRYFGHHNARLAFSELTGLCPFMKETADEWLRPLHIRSDTKDRKKDKEEREKKFRQPDLELEALLPSREETDTLVSVYLDQFEQVHRIIHIPSFRREYAKFWDPGHTRTAAFTVLVLAMISITSCPRKNGAPRFEKMVSSYHNCALRWIKACDEWQERQSQKHRRLIHYQISCLIYLAKRVNTVKKKRFWKEAGMLTQDGVSVGLHKEPTQMSDRVSPFNQEMRRRIWATLESFDLQASFDHGLPSILSALHYDVDPPRNLDDDEFDEDTTELPASRPPNEYTYSSYQHLSRQSLPLRLELSRVLTGPRQDLGYEQVIQYTNEINQEIDSLPSWEVEVNENPLGQKTPLLAYTLLHVQLRQYIIPLHQTFLRLRKSNSKYQYSEIIYYNAARDMVLLNDKLVQQGIRTLNFLREDNLTLAINLCSVTMLQPRGSTNMIMINSQHTLQLLEKCIIMKEDRILRCGNNEPWGYSIMCAAFGLLEAHLDAKTPESAKAAAAERFINLHLKLLSGQAQGQPLSQEPQSSQQSEMSGLPNPSPAPSNPIFAPPPAPSDIFVRSKSVTPFPSASQGSGPPVPPGAVEVPGTPWWLPNPTEPSITPQMQPVNPDFSFEMIGLNLNELWGDQWDWDYS